jgi:hypothetical protein
MPKVVKVGEIEVPMDYWSISEGEKTVFCLTIIDSILTILDKQVRPDLDRLYIFKKLIESSLVTNEMDENYEVCQVLKDIRKIIDEEDI